MANTYISRTFGTPTNSAIWTFSVWFKRSKISATMQIFTAGSGSTDQTRIGFTGSDFLNVNRNIGGSEVELLSTKKFRDINGWYHLVVQNNSGTAAVYVNGVAVSLNSSSLGTNKINQASVVHQIGDTPASGENFNGLMSHIHFVDGTIYAPTVFGSTDSVTGEWKINTSPSVTYGNNGFFILKDGNSITDQSGEGNNWTLSSGTLTDTKDCPSNVFATWNPLAQTFSSIGYEHGNTTIATSADVGQRQSISTLAASSGKFYMECKLQAIGSNVGSSYPYAGASPQSNFESDTYTGNASIGYGTTGYVYLNNNSGTNTGTTYTSGDIISVALDVTNSKIYFAKNGTYISNGTGIGNPTTGANPFDISSLTSIDAMGFATSLYNNNGTWQCNFGNGTFGTSAVTSAGTAGSTPGTFEYDVPSGYEPLSTKGLNA
jgi:hypothetical protein|tara:strand:+ start:216 stop:1514 length:1299 start_codon:yes stop_codon:yes gene_type:complete